MYKNLDENSITKIKLMEENFVEMFISDLKLKSNGNKNIWQDVNNNNVISQNIINKSIIFSNTNFWFKFQKKFKCNANEAKVFLNIIVEKHLELIGYNITVSPNC